MMTNYRILLLSFLTISWIFLCGLNNPVNPNEFEKPLDLSVPFKTPENANLKIEQKSTPQSRVTNIFAPETKKKRRSFEVDGGFLMSPEPEAEKQKTVDGAGFVIKLKP